jgi:sulfate transport system substrate-binding protein
MLRRYANPTSLLNGGAVVLVVVAFALLFHANYFPSGPRQILNASYDPTRELYDQINRAFLAEYEKRTGIALQIRLAHGASSNQARAVADGLAADVVTLALPSDIDGLAQRGLIAKDWRARLPDLSQPYFSTIVFVVRKSNPLQIRDWADLVRPGISIVTPDPRTSGNGKLSFLSAWGSIVNHGGTEAEAREFVGKLYGNVLELGQGARDSTTTFVYAKHGDVQLTWENEAIRVVRESQGDLEIVYPASSIRAEPSVAWVDANVASHGTESASQTYLTYLFSDAAQEIIAQNGYRPINPRILEQHSAAFPKIDLFPITRLAAGWDEAQAKFFGENGVYEVIRSSLVKK